MGSGLGSKKGIIEGEEKNLPTELEQEVPGE